MKPALRNFSVPQRVGKDLNGYDGTSITDDMVADVYARFSEHRQRECEEHLRTLTGTWRQLLPYSGMALNLILTAATTLSLDATFRTAAKASFVNDDRSRSSIFNGGLHTAVNQKALIIAYMSLFKFLDIELVSYPDEHPTTAICSPWSLVLSHEPFFRVDGGLGSW